MNLSNLFNSLPELDVAELGEQEIRCLEDVRLYLISKGLEGRFAICRLHKHFDLEDGEIMVESRDLDGRVRRRCPQRVADDEALARFVPFTWRLDVENPVSDGPIYFHPKK